MKEVDEALLDQILDLARQYSNRKDKEAHIAVLLEPYLKCRESDAYAWFLYGDALRVIGRAKEAWPALQKALELTPSPP